MVCQDLVRHYGRKNVKPSCIMKLGLKKVYDTIEWDFLEEMLATLKFPEKCIKLIMTYVRTPKFSLMVNGAIHGYFSSKRGLRQGDLISPLLFVICMEYLTRIMRSMEEHPLFKFHPRCKQSKLTHMVFADDINLCCAGEFPTIYTTLQALKLFLASSGLQISE